MMNSIVIKLIDLAARAGFVVRRHRPASHYAAFLETLRPVETEHPLIRIGGARDGGYLVPDDLDGITACFSPGVDRVATFETDMIHRGMKVFQIDASVEESPLTHPNNQFERKFLGISTRGHFITLDDWVNQKVGDAPGDLILQMDIEGAEWLTLAQVSEATLKRFRVIVVELHNLHMMVEPFLPDLFTPVMERLRAHFDLVHLHANNCAWVMRGKDTEMPSVLEATFLRKDRSTRREPVKSLPHPLDQDNEPSLPPAHIPKALYA